MADEGKKKIQGKRGGDQIGRRFGTDSFDHYCKLEEMAFISERAVAHCEQDTTETY